MSRKNEINLLIRVVHVVHVDLKKTPPSRLEIGVYKATCLLGGINFSPPRSTWSTRLVYHIGT
jgi:hypothetical protein